MKKDNLFSRRSFFKKTISGVLPIVGVLALPTSLLSACSSSDDDEDDYDEGSFGGGSSCGGACSALCRNGCKSLAEDKPASCKTGCKGACKKAVTILASVHRLLMVKITDARVVLQSAIMVVLIVQDLVLEVVVVALALLLVKGDAVGYVRQIAVSHVLKWLIGDEYKGIRNCMARKLLKEYHLHCHQRLPACL